jgi:hypothetical protein
MFKMFKMFQNSAHMQRENFSLAGILLAALPDGGRITKWEDVL